jgi:hypothetical protein
MYSRFDNGQPAVIGQRINANRAAEIHAANQDAAQKGCGVVDFNGGGSSWERSYFGERGYDDEISHKVAK